MSVTPKSVFSRRFQHISSISCSVLFLGITILVKKYKYIKNIIQTEIINIGDYIQSIAALQFLPKNCAPILIDRDTIQYYHGPKLKLIVNGWFGIKEGNRFTSEQIRPFYISFHIQNGASIDIRMINHLKNYQPIGCRDYYTYNLLLIKLAMVLIQKGEKKVSKLIFLVV